MTQEDKELLLKDLNQRLLYGVKVNYSGKIPMLGEVSNNVGELTGIMPNLQCPFYIHGSCWGFDDIKPFLRPMDSMTEEEKEDFYQNCLDMDVEDIRYENDGELPLPYNQKDKFIWFESIYIDNVICAMDWLNAHHFDFRGLIERGLALEAPEGMYNFKD